MTESSSAAEEAPVEFGDLLEERNTDALVETEPPDDKLEDFEPSTGWPDPGFEDVAFAPQPDGGVS